MGVNGAPPSLHSMRCFLVSRCVMPIQYKSQKIQLEGIPPTHSSLRNPHILFLLFFFFSSVSGLQMLFTYIFYLHPCNFTNSFVGYKITVLQYTQSRLHFFARNRLTRTQICMFQLVKMDYLGPAAPRSIFALVLLISSRILYRSAY